MVGKKKRSVRAPKRKKGARVFVVVAHEMRLAWCTAIVHHRRNNLGVKASKIFTLIAMA